MSFLQLNDAEARINVLIGHLSAKTESLKQINSIE